MYFLFISQCLHEQTIMCQRLWWQALHSVYVYRTYLHYNLSNKMWATWEEERSCFLVAVFGFHKSTQFGDILQRPLTHKQCWCLHKADWRSSASLLLLSPTGSYCPDCHSSNRRRCSFLQIALYNNKTQPSASRVFVILDVQLELLPSSDQQMDTRHLYFLFIVCCGRKRNKTLKRELLK